MNQKIKKLIVWGGWISVFFNIGNKAIAQSGYPDTSVIDAPIVDTTYSDDYEDEEYAESDDAAKTRAKANAFDRLDTAVLNPVSLRKLNKNYLERLKNDDAFAYVKNGIPKPGSKKRKLPNSFQMEGVKIWLIIAIAAFIIFLIWYLSQNNLLLFRKKPASLQTRSDEEDKDIFSINYNDAIQKAITDRNYRLAIRLQYLQVLKTLTDRRIINYRPDKTNFEYLLQLKPTDYYTDFLNITRNYEYSWYGLFAIDEGRYNQIKTAFTDFQKKIS
ncbi:MAG: hypothetical protein QM640_17235 [Niabella sp.]